VFPLGVTAHGGPTGLLQFDRLEAALAAKFHCNTGPNPPRGHLNLGGGRECHSDIWTVVFSESGLNSYRIQ
jgi:hypothetical protein